MKYEKLIHKGLTALTAIYLISGLGITRTNIIEPLTLGLLTKSLSFRIHSVILIPFVILLGLHIYSTVRSKHRKK
ncbi:MAG: hypothetical protein GOV00_04590 [Candidatus Altiarchaeota archaeon]|nr:hypothetical protein [Candidatus Altiarchaeota archaeon]